MGVTTIMHGEVSALLGCFDLAVPPHVHCVERRKTLTFCVSDAAKVEIKHNSSAKCLLALTKLNQQKYFSLRHGI